MLKLRSFLQQQQQHRTVLALSGTASSQRWKDLYLSGGVYLGGTASDNKLDDYEEGTWTPTFDATTTSPTVAYNTQSAKYTKVGRLVTATALIIGHNTRSGGAGHLFTH